MPGQTVWERIKFFTSHVSPHFLQYETPRMLLVRSKTLGIVYALLRLLLLAYLIGYVLVQSKSYQAIDEPKSSIIWKVKGILRRTDSEIEGGAEIWDNQDYVVPPVENNALFIATNFVYTRNQTQGICPEDHLTGMGEGINCTRDSHCKKDKETTYGHGIQTGICNRTTRTCQIRGWCPVEVDNPPGTPTLRGFETVTILVKNYIYFPRFDERLSNLLPHFTPECMQKCRYHPVNDPYCPIFPLSQIIHDAEEGLDTEKLAVKGGVIAFNIEWNCDLDYDKKYCRPKYSFKRLDDSHAKVGSGWNFRTPYYYYDRSHLFKRDVVKFWGIRFIFDVHGKAGRFSVISFLIHVGSAMGLFGIASMICEFILNSCLITPTLDDHKVLRLEDLLQLIQPERSSFGSHYSIQRQVTTVDPFQLVLRDKFETKVKPGIYGTAVADREKRTLATSFASVKPVETTIDMEPGRTPRPYSAPASPMPVYHPESDRNLNPWMVRYPESMHILNCNVIEARDPFRQRERSRDQYWV